MSDIAVSSEEEAFSLLEKALKNELHELSPEVSFNNWPILSVRIDGNGYESTITADIAEAVIALQKSINRSYARVVHSSTTSRILTDDERKKLSFKARVKEGSSLMEVNLGEPLKELVNGLLGKMEPTHIVITVLGVAAMWGGVAAYKAYLQAQTGNKTIEEETKKSIGLSAEETKRQEVLASAISQKPVLDLVRQDIAEAHREFLKSVSDAKSITVQGVSMDADTAGKIASSIRTESKAVQLNGRYKIRKIDWQKDDEVKIWLSNIDNGLEFVAGFNADGIEQSQKDTLQKAEWERKPIQMSINANMLRGEVTAAAIVGVSWPEDTQS